MKKRSEGSSKRALISDCFNSSRLTMHRRRGRYLVSMISTNLLPKDPVPPVMSTDASRQFSGPSVVTPMIPPATRSPSLPPQGLRRSVSSRAFRWAGGDGLAKAHDPGGRHAQPTELGQQRFGTLERGHHDDIELLRRQLSQRAHGISQELAAARREHAERLEP